MAVFNGRTIVVMPTTPAPADVQYTRTNTVAVGQSPFTGQQQVQDWGGFWMEATLTMPSMSTANGLIWRDFLLSANGQANVFAFANSVLLASVPSAANTSGYWALKSNSFKWSIKPGLIYGFSIELKEAK